MDLGAVITNTDWVIFTKCLSAEFVFIEQMRFFFYYHIYFMDSYRKIKDQIFTKNIGLEGQDMDIITDQVKRAQQKKLKQTNSAK